MALQGGWPMKEGDDRDEGGMNAPEPRIVWDLGQPIRARLLSPGTVGLSTPYWPPLISVLKGAIRAETVRVGVLSGGWLATERLWVISLAGWPVAYGALIREGYSVSCEPPLPEPSAIDWPVDTGGEVYAMRAGRNQ